MQEVPRPAPAAEARDPKRPATDLPPLPAAGIPSPRRRCAVIGLSASSARARTRGQGLRPNPLPCLNYPHGDSNPGP